MFPKLIKLFLDQSSQGILGVRLWNFCRITHLGSHLTTSPQMSSSTHGMKLKLNTKIYILTKYISTWHISILHTKSHFPCHQQKLKNVAINQLLFSESLSRESFKLMSPLDSEIRRGFCSPLYIFVCQFWLF